MKKLVILSVLAVLIASPVMAMPTVLVTRTPGTYPAFPTGSGEWTLTPNADLATLIGSAASFQTFCLERYEPMAVGGIYEAIINNEAIEGNGRGPGEAAGPDGGDLLDSKTAWLYTQFVNGTLIGYPGTNHPNSASALQHAIWCLEYEIDKNALTPEAKFYVDLAIANDPGTIGNVRVLNLWDVRGSKVGYQDMLVTVVPAPGAILLAGIGTSLVGWMRRKRAL